jgi:hypothetical protein
MVDSGSQSAVLSMIRDAAPATFSGKSVKKYRPAFSKYEDQEAPCFPKDLFFGHNIDP